MRANRAAARAPSSSHSNVAAIGPTDHKAMQKMLDSDSVWRNSVRAKMVDAGVIAVTNYFIEKGFQMEDSEVQKAIRGSVTSNLTGARDDYRDFYLKKRIAELESERSELKERLRNR